MKVRKLFGVLVFMMAIIIMPKNVFAESNADVKVRTGGMDENATIVATIPIEQGVTRVAEVKEVLKNDYNINFNNYVITDMNYNEINENSLLCTGNLSCYGPIERPFTYLELVEVDNTKKEITVNSIPAVDDSMFYNIYQTNYDDYGGMSFKSCDETYAKCTFFDYKTKKIYNNVVINYSYDKTINKLAQKIIDAGLLNRSEFSLTDTEFINYINYGGTLADYSSDFKNQLGNSNFKFEMDARAGGFDPFGTHQAGFYKFLYDGKLYGVKDFSTVSAKHIIYVPSDATDIKKAIENRLKDILGNDNHITVTESNETANAYLTREGLETIANGNVHYYTLTSTNEKSDTMDMEFAFLAVKDSSKINNNVSFKSNDIITNVSVSTDKKIPLDTLIKVSELTSGDEYNKIISALNVTNSEMFDISLYSNAQDKPITKLDNGKFEVRIPIPDKLNGKTLTVYYVANDGTIEEHKVTIKDGYAVFETDHFSIYTLAEKTSSSASSSEVTISEGNASTTSTSESTNISTKNPKTGDNIGTYIITLLLSLMGFSLVIISNKKKGYTK